MRHSLARLASVLLCACGPAPVSPEPPTPLSRPAPNHNRIVGTYTGTTSLPDGRSLAVEIVLDRTAYAAGRYTFGGTSSDFRDIPFDLRNGTLKMGSRVAVPITPDGTTTLSLMGFPARAGTTRLFHRVGQGAETAIEVNLVREHEPLGGDNRATILNPSTDANVDRTPVTFAALVTEFAVPGPREGTFTAFGSIGPMSDQRRFSLLVHAIEKFSEHYPTVVRPITIPQRYVQLNYNEQQPDGTIRQWAAKSGRIVFDAADGDSVSESGQPSDFGLYTFHFEDVRMEPSNSVSDPRFVGAVGTFTFAFSGTSSQGKKYLSR